MNEKIASDFKRREFLCRCCEKEGIQQKLVNALQLAHDKLPDKRVMIIRSGYRCPEHNLKSGGKETSSHVKGWAVDIQCDTSAYRFILIDALMQAGFTRFGVDFKRDFIHVDLDPDKPNDLMWGYS
jgi:uncharacterized protein YcbK (DUF882 family)